jgi:two-component system phosphate regulon response regulator PhoB
MTSVLVVDDSAPLRHLLRVAKDRAGFDVLEAATELDVRRCLARTRPDALLLDLQSATDGLALLVRLRTRQALCEVPIMLLAGCADAELPWQAVQAGADWYGLRPVSMRTLQTRLGDLIRTGRAAPRRSADDDVDQLAWHEDDPLNSTRGYVRLNAG